MSERAARSGSGRQTRIEVALDRGVFMISVAAELAEMHRRRCGCMRRAG